MGKFVIAYRSPRTAASLGAGFGRESVASAATANAYSDPFRPVAIVGFAGSHRNIFDSAAVSCVLGSTRKILAPSQRSNCFAQPGFPMTFDRRAFIAGSVGAVLAGTGVTATAASVQARRSIRAVLFDAFPLFDSRPVLAAAERAYPEKGAILMQAWRNRQFEYQWLRALADRYVDFWQATQDSLAFAARQVGLTLTTEKQNQLMAPYADLAVWPDVLDVLPKIERLGVTLGILSNMTGP